MGINRNKLTIVSLFLITICSFFLPLSIHATSRGISVISDLSHQSGKLGAYRALLIGINDYNDPKIPDLKTAVNDATATANLLRKRYGFKVKLLLDRKATRKAIYQALRSLASSTKPDDSVLIYYAGHGDLDRLTNDGWWIPVDAKGGDPVTYLNNFLVQTYIRSMRARHVLLVSDSCYSGTLFGQARAIPQVIDDKYYLNLYNEKSRWGMTSGNKTPVSDRGTGNHSVFAYQLLKELRKNEKPYISAQEIYTRIAPIVSNNSEQTPLCRPIRNTGDQGGEFVFVASSGAVIEKPSSEPTNAFISVESNVSGAKVLIDGHYVGTTSLSDVKITTGEHSIRVEKDGYEPYTKRIWFEKGRTRDLYVVMDPKTPVKGRLYVDTQPEDARIRILNIRPAFHQGIELDAGRHHVEVSASEYETKKMWVTLGSGEDKSIDVRLKKRAIVPSSLYIKPKDTKTVRRFIAFGKKKIKNTAPGLKFTSIDIMTVKDTKTGLMWASKDNGKDINWEDAKRYCENYKGGGYTDWRMPTIDELAGLYDRSESYQPEHKSYNVHLTRLIRLTSCCLWASEKRDFIAGYFLFSQGLKSGAFPSDSHNYRALPVRSDK